MCCRSIVGGPAHQRLGEETSARFTVPSNLFHIYDSEEDVDVTQMEHTREDMGVASHHVTQMEHTREDMGVASHHVTQMEHTREDMGVPSHHVMLKSKKNVTMQKGSFCAKSKNNSTAGLGATTQQNPNPKHSDKRHPQQHRKVSLQTPQQAKEMVKGHETQYTPSKVDGGRMIQNKYSGDRIKKLKDHANNTSKTKAKQLDTKQTMQESEESRMQGKKRCTAQDPNHEEQAEEYFYGGNEFEQKIYGGQRASNEDNTQESGSQNGKGKAAVQESGDVNKSKKKQQVPKNDDVSCDSVDEQPVATVAKKKTQERNARFSFQENVALVESLIPFFDKLQGNLKPSTDSYWKLKKMARYYRGCE
ncbi:titin homolog [Hyperolius riggenbachi]|uniref:titin homolog n=1 Tax=Hyperolius riggenbachi TaxID=752182 RepID=UPI0035A2972E